MMRKTNVSATAFLAALLLVSIYAVFPVKAPARADADIRFYSSQEMAYAALAAGDVDFIQGSVTYEQKLGVEGDPNLCIAGYNEDGMYEFDLNNNYTVPMTYPGLRNPLHVKEFRQALSCAVDKYHIVNFILKGVAGVLNVPIPLTQMSWWPGCAYPGNYPWEYNMTKAAELLMAAGFVDLEPDGILNYPAAWPGSPGQPNMDPLVVYVRTEDKLLDAGRYLCDQLDLLGIPYNKIEATSDVCYPAVMGDRNYHIYTGEWLRLKPYPIYLYELYHSNFWFPDGSNYVTGMNSSNLPNYPELDALLEDMYYRESIESSKTAAQAAVELGWCDLVVTIPLWSYNSFVAWRKTMPGVVNMFGYGLDNNYQFLNAYNTLPSPIKMGTISVPEALNPLYSRGYCDYAVLDRVYSTLLSLSPYDLAIVQPWVAQDWEDGTWIDPNPGPGEPSEKTMLTYYIRQDVGIVSPTGMFMRNYTAHDVDFTIWYTYAFGDSCQWHAVMDVHHTRIVNDYTIEVYFDDASYWFSLAMGLQMRLLVKDELIDQLCTTSSVTVTGPLPANTFVKLATTDQIVQVTSDTLPEDFHICGGYEDYEHNWIWLPDGLSSGTYTINYYTTDLDPHGFYLAGLDWTQTWYSIGTHYPVAIAPGVGGYVAFDKNPYFFLDPPLGEVDWQWVWDTPGNVPGPEIPGCDSGYFEVTLFDFVRATASYCHSGTGSYDPQYFPGADLDPTDLGHVGILDIEIVTGAMHQAPIADFTASPRDPTTGQQVVFDASGSYDPDGEIVSYQWDFGDGTTATDLIVSHAWELRGFYVVNLTVTDNDGLADYTTKTMAVNPVQRAYAEHAKYDVSKDEDAYNDLTVKLINDGTASVEVTATFYTYDRRTSILIGLPLEATGMATAGTDLELTVGWNPAAYGWPGTKSKYTVTVQVTYEDVDGTILAGETKVSFQVVP